MTVSADYQFELGAGSPLLMGPTTSYKITNVAGLEWAPVTAHDLLLNSTTGAYAARDVIGGRTVSLDLRIVASSASGLITAITTFLTAWQPTNTDIKLTWQLPGQASRYVYGRPRRVAAPISYTETPFGFTSKAAADFFCQSPTIRTTSGDTIVVY